MRQRCPSGKRVFSSQQIAEDVLIECWIKNDYAAGQAPVAVYQCDDCGNYHLTSGGAMNPKLSELLSDRTFKLKREAARWSEKFKRK
jgi:hypothetical protein